MTTLLSREVPIQAFCAADDEIEIGARKALTAHHCEIPRDAAVIGFDNIRFAHYATTSLSTIH